MNQKKEPLKHQAYEQIKRNIVNCVYAPGTVINEELIREQVEGSRTPIRDALSRLEHEGLVVILPKKGILVTDITLNELNTLYETRLLLEPYAIHKYGSRIPQDVYVTLYRKYQAFLSDPGHPYSYSDMDNDFHHMIIEATGNSYFISMYSTIESQITRTRILTGHTSQERLVETIHEHTDIVKSALKQNWEEAADAMRIHLEQSKNSSFNYLLKREQERQENS